MVDDADNSDGREPGHPSRESAAPLSDQETRIIDESQAPGAPSASEPWESVDPTAPTRVIDAGDKGTSAAASSGSGDEDAYAPTVLTDEPEKSSPARVEATGRSGDARPTLTPGSVLFGEYEIVGVLGVGGMGEVYRARHRRLDEFRAIKVMHADLSGRQGASEFFDREAKALLAVRHPAVVHCHDLLSDAEGRVYLIMEMIEGLSLSDRMAEGPLSADDVALLGARVGAGLAAAHAKGVIHRDVSPDNIVLPGNEVAEAKLIDFGIAKILQEGDGTIIDGFKGKLGYASPEQLGFFQGAIDGRSDFYSLGLVLCAAALGQPMGMGATVMQAVDARRQLHTLPAEIPIGLRSAIMPLLALDPADRPTNVERLFASPSAIVESAPPQQAASSAPQTGSGPSPLAIGLAAAGGAVLLVAGGLFLSGGSENAAGDPNDLATIPASADPVPVEPSPATVARTAAPERSAAAATQAQPDTAEPAPKKPVVRRLSALDKVKIAGLLGGAEAAIEDNRLQSPPGDNAYAKYQAVLEIDPGNRMARLGLSAVAARYVTLGRNAVDAGDLDRADAFIAKATEIDAKVAGLADLRDQRRTASATSRPVVESSDEPDAATPPTPALAPDAGPALGSD